jgi:TfoX/Sxy family transcriptional regulator of competence genes
MPSDQAFADELCYQIRLAGEVTVRKMFGEFAVYCEGRVVGLICDNQFFLKPTEAGRELLAELTWGQPYPGAKPYFLLDSELENPRRMQELIRVTAAELPLPKPKKKKTTKKSATPLAGNRTNSRKKKTEM